MSGDAHAEDANLKGLAKYFNSTTIRGRANVSKSLDTTLRISSTNSRNLQMRDARQIT